MRIMRDASNEPALEMTGFLGEQHERANRFRACHVDPRRA
jgi:hypothetical protein